MGVQSTRLHTTNSSMWLKKTNKKNILVKKKRSFSNTDFSLIKAANCLFLTRFYQNQKVLVLGHAEKEECIYWTEW